MPVGSSMNPDHDHATMTFSTYAFSSQSKIRQLHIQDAEYSRCYVIRPIGQGKNRTVLVQSRIGINGCQRNASDRAFHHPRLTKLPAPAERTAKRCRSRSQLNRPDATPRTACDRVLHETPARLKRRLTSRKAVAPVTERCGEQPFLFSCHDKYILTNDKSKLRCRHNQLRSSEGFSGEPAGNLEGT